MGLYTNLPHSNIVDEGGTVVGTVETALLTATISNGRDETTCEILNPWVSINEDGDTVVNGSVKDGDYEMPAETAEAQAMIAAAIGGGLYPDATY